MSRLKFDAALHYASIICLYCIKNSIIGLVEHIFCSTYVRLIVNSSSGLAYDNRQPNPSSQVQGDRQVYRFILIRSNEQCLEAERKIVIGRNQGKILQLFSNICILINNRELKLVITDSLLFFDPL